MILDVGRDPPTGRRRQRWKGGYKTRKAAEAAFRELMAEVDAGTYVARSSVTLARYVTECLQTVQPPAFADNVGQLPHHGREGVQVPR